MIVCRREWRKSEWRETSAILEVDDIEWTRVFFFGGDNTKNKKKHKTPQTVPTRKKKRRAHSTNKTVNKRVTKQRGSTSLLPHTQHGPCWHHQWPWRSYQFRTWWRQSSCQWRCPIYQTRHWVSVSVWWSVNVSCDSVEELLVRVSPVWIACLSRSLAPFLSCVRVFVRATVSVGLGESARLLC